MGVMTDDELDPRIIEAAREYHRPSDIAPREAMWDAIQARRRAAEGEPKLRVVTSMPASVPTVKPVRAIHRWPPWSYAAAATVILTTGIAIGVGLRPPRGAQEIPSQIAGQPADNRVAYQLAATEHFGQVETFLTWYRATPDQRADAQLSAWARDLLASTRLFMDSPAGQDPQRKQLLQDLELVLVQLVQISPDVTPEDRTMLDNMLRQTTLLLTRLRTTVPAGMAAAH
jgi:hypothetical protein